MRNLQRLIERAERLFGRLEELLPDPPPAPDWNARAFRWRSTESSRWLQPVPEPQHLPLSDLCCIDRQKAEIVRNTEQFLAGLGANNLLLWGSRGTGKSSLIKAVFTEMSGRGLRLIEVDKEDLFDLPDILELIRGRPERFILYCDDLSFEASESGYKALKAVLDGSILAVPYNLLIYATSNRRHLIPELQRENREAQAVDGEIHPGEGTEEKISLSDRFGLWVSFYPFTQDQYLEVVRHWLARLGMNAELDQPTERAALQWAQYRGSRSGRTAWQFARDWTGRHRVRG